MGVVVDASVVVKWFVLEPLHDEARALLTAGEPLVAPDILATELANAMWAKARREEMALGDALRAIDAVIGGRGQPTLRASAPLLRKAFLLANELGHPVYDCVYLALATELDLPLVTADRRFARQAAEHSGSRVRSLAEWTG